MVIDIVMPKMGESITEGTILEWRKKVGDKIETDEIFLEIGTDKVDSEIPSPNSGIITEILANPNDVVEVGKVIARINTNGKGNSKTETPPISEPIQETLQGPSSNPPTMSKSNATPSKPNMIASEDKRFYTPVVKAIAKEEGIGNEELATIPGTGKNDRVSKKDILGYLKQRDMVSSSEVTEAPVPTTPIPQNVSSVETGDRQEMDKMRKSIAEHMRKSLDTSAHVHLMKEVDMTHIVKFVNDKNNWFMEKEGFSLTYTPFIVQACVRALQLFPDMNSSIDGTTIVRKKNVNIGLAVAVEAGLMVPVISQCEELNFLGLCRKVRDLAIRSRNKQIKPEELSGSTFSISNFGVFDVIAGTPIINQPNVGILGVGAIKKKPVVIESGMGDSIAIRNIMVLSLGFDHRLIDGAGGSQFIQSVQKSLESVELDQLF